MKPTLQERIEASGFGKSIISGLLLFIVYALIAWNIPYSELKRFTFETVRPVVLGFGLDQIWSVFAPEPRSYGMDLQARITYADGTEEMWSWPRKREPFLSVYAASRWEKWADNARVNRHRELWQPTAAWVARTHQSHGVPVEVTLIRRAEILLPPGPGPDAEPWKSFEFFTLQVTPEILSGDDTTVSMFSL